MEFEYRFDNFVQNKRDKTAYDFAQCVSEGVFKDVINPLVLYGPSGSGKTHLSEAIRAVIKGRKTITIDCRSFMEKYLQYLKQNMDMDHCMYRFLFGYKQYDLITIESIDLYLSEKEMTSELFIEIISKFIEEKKQIILTANNEMVPFFSNLKEVCKRTVFAELGDQNLEMREKIAKLKLKEAGLNHDRGFRIIARATRNGSQIEGFVRQLLSYKELGLTHHEIEKETFYQVIIDRGYLKQYLDSFPFEIPIYKFHGLYTQMKKKGICSNGREEKNCSF